MLLSTHVLDTARGTPAAGLEVALFALGEQSRELARGTTDVNGRIASPFGGELAAGTYELRFFVRAYFATQRTPSFYDEVPVRFIITDAAQHHHIPLLISPFSYTTYRGS
jgi:5-hydroxyisourate hydrolase